MSDRASSLTRARRDGGFTLIEILIVVAMIGFLTATLASVFTVIVRTTPDADARVTDARSLKGLVTWIPQDMDAAPPTGFDDSHSAWGCAGAAPADSHNVIAMSWTEVGDVTSSFHASYRYEFRNGEWVIARYSCQDGGTARRVNMTSELSALEFVVTACVGRDVQHADRRRDRRLSAGQRGDRPDDSAGRVDEGDPHAARRLRCTRSMLRPRIPTRTLRTIPMPSPTTPRLRVYRPARSRCSRERRGCSTCKPSMRSAIPRATS